jgi:hypothetical protein
MNWGRAHDAWIARECEGLEVLTCEQSFARVGILNAHWMEEVRSLQGDAWVMGPQGEWVPVATYNTDPAACIRAAEAWQLAVTGRQVHLSMAPDRTRRAQVFNGEGWNSATGTNVTTALAQALYRATGGPA